MSDTEASNAATWAGILAVKPMIGAAVGAAAFSTVVGGYNREIVTGLSFLPSIPSWVMGAALGMIDSWVGDMVHEGITGLDEGEKLQAFHSFVATLGIGAGTWTAAAYLYDMRIGWDELQLFTYAGALSAFGTQLIYETFFAHQNRIPTLF